MNVLQIKLQLDDNAPAHWFDVKAIDFDDEVCFRDSVGEHIEIEYQIEYQGEPLRIKHHSLSDNQQVVLEWFKNEKKTQPFATVADFFTAYFEGTEEVPLHTMVSFEQLSTAEQFQVLAAFAEWGLEDKE